MGRGTVRKGRGTLFSPLLKRWQGGRFPLVTEGLLGLSRS